MTLVRKPAFLLVAVLVIFTLATQPAAAKDEQQRTGVPSIVGHGFEAYAKGGRQAAAKRWAEEDGPLTPETLLGLLQKVEDVCGPYKSWNLIAIKEFSPSTKAVYGVVNYRRAPVFVHFMCYQTESGWVVTTMVLNTDPAQVLPAGLLAVNR